MSGPGTPDPLEMMEAYQRTAIVAAAVTTGLADAVAGAGAGADEAAAACGTDPRATRALLGALVALGLAERRGEAFALSDAGAELASTHPRSLAKIVAKEWFFYGAWAGLPQTVRDGHARIAPWRERLAEDQQQSRDFLRALDDLALRFGGELPELAGPLSGRLLDAGGGAGSHAANLLAANPGLQATVLDLPDVAPVLEERHPEIPFLAGDLDEDRFGRPAGEQWDAVLLANILHDLPPERAAAAVGRAASLLAPGGTLLLYEWVLDPDRCSPAPVALFAVMMMVENEGGAAYTAEELAGWVEDAGLLESSVSRGGGPIAVLRARAPS